MFKIHTNESISTYSRADFKRSTIDADTIFTVSCNAEHRRCNLQISIHHNKISCVYANGHCSCDRYINIATLNLEPAVVCLQGNTVH
ncbi:MAG: hypothetical protein IJY22_06210, partial [Clostridia bacterium]|nr:hypothetical protein [Clostridia bacterium]